MLKAALLSLIFSSALLARDEGLLATLFIRDFGAREGEVLAQKYQHLAKGKNAYTIALLDMELQKSPHLEAAKRKMLEDYIAEQVNLTEEVAVNFNCASELKKIDFSAISILDLKNVGAILIFDSDHQYSGHNSPCPNNFAKYAQLKIDREFSSIKKEIHALAADQDVSLEEIVNYQDRVNNCVDIIWGLGPAQTQNLSKRDFVRAYLNKKATKDVVIELFKQDSNLSSAGRVRPFRIKSEERLEFSLASNVFQCLFKDRKRL